MSERARKQTGVQTVRLTITLEASLEDLTEARVRQDLASFSNEAELVQDPELWREVEWQRQLGLVVDADGRVVPRWPSPDLEKPQIRIESGGGSAQHRSGEEDAGGRPAP